MNKAGLAGEMMVSSMMAVGCVGMLSNGPSRDVDAIRKLRFQLLLGGVTAGHGEMAVQSVNVPVSVGGMDVAPGDLIHMDENGAVKFPPKHAPAIVKNAQAMLDDEARRLVLLRKAKTAAEVRAASSGGAYTPKKSGGIASRDGGAASGGVPAELPGRSRNTVGKKLRRSNQKDVASLVHNLINRSLTFTASAARERSRRASRGADWHSACENCGNCGNPHPGREESGRDDGAALAPHHLHALQWRDHAFASTHARLERCTRAYSGLIVYLSGCVTSEPRAAFFAPTPRRVHQAVGIDTSRRAVPSLIW